MEKKIEKVIREDLPDVTKSRTIRIQTKLALVASAGGRCEFLGCNDYLFAHKVTKTVGYFGNYAHIRAFSPRGPRAGNNEERAGVDLNDVQNLLLLCPTCHDLVDTAAKDYPLDKLQQWKHDHEAHVTHMLELPDENEASVIEIWTNLANPPVIRSQAQLIAALLPYYPSKVRSALINLSQHNLSDLTLVPAAAEQIDKECEKLFGSTGERPSRLAIFGITNIPLLVYLGAKVGDRQDVRLFQYHRDTKDWKWKDEPAKADYSVLPVAKGDDKKRVVLILSLSGTVDRSEIPAEVLAGAYIYEIALSSDVPNRDFLRTLEDLELFRTKYRKFLSELQRDHGSLQEIVVIPAVPIPVAVSIGMDRLPKVHPALAVYDLNRSIPEKKQYKHVLTVS